MSVPENGAPTVSNVNPGHRGVVIYETLNETDIANCNVMLDADVKNVNLKIAVSDGDYAVILRYMNGSE